MLNVRPDVRVAADRKERHGVLALPDRCRLVSEVGMGATEVGVPLRVMWGRLQHFLVRYPGGVGIRARLGLIPPGSIGLPKHDAPCRAVAVERARSEAQ